MQTQGCDFVLDRRPCPGAPVAVLVVGADHGAPVRRRYVCAEHEPDLRAAYGDQVVRLPTSAEGRAAA